MNTIYLKTDKAGREGSKLSAELKRVLALLDDRSGVDDLAKQAAPSLRKIWYRLVNELAMGGYIVPDPRANIATKGGPEPKSGTNDPDYQKKMHAVEQMIAVLEAAEKREKEKSAIEIERMIAVLKAAEEAGKIKPDIGAKAKAVTQRQAERAARIAELKSYFAAEKEKAKADIKQSPKDATNAEMQAAAIARKKSETKARSSAGEKNRERETDDPLLNLRRPLTPPKPGRT